MADKYYNVKMTEKELQTLCDIIATVMNKDDDDFCGEFSVGYCKCDKDNEFQIRTACGDDFEFQNEKEETLGMCLSYLVKHLLPIPVEG